MGSGTWGFIFSTFECLEFFIIKFLKAVKRVHCEVGDLMKTQVQDDFVFSEGNNFWRTKICHLLLEHAYIIFRSYGLFFFSVLTGFCIVSQAIQL